MSTPGKTNSSKITMGSMAKQLGISPTAVYLALKGLPGVSSATRIRVQKLSDTLHYRPDPAVTSAALSRWNTGEYDRHSVIAFLCHHTPPSQTQQDVFLEAASARCREIGYKLEPIYVDKYPDAKSIARVLSNRGINGVLIPPLSAIYAKGILSPDWDCFATVCCGTGRTPLPLHTVADNVFVNTRLLWKMAVETGYRRIGAVLHYHDPIDEDDWNRIGASYASQDILRIQQNDRIPPLLAPFNDDDLLYKWFFKYQPEIIIGFNPTTAVSLARKGVKFPEDAAFVALSTDKNSPCSGIIRRYELIAQISVDVLAEEIRNQCCGKPELHRTILIPPAWNTGSTFIADTSQLKSFTDSPSFQYKSDDYSIPSHRSS